MLQILIIAILTVKCLGQTTSSIVVPETGGGSTTSAGQLATLPQCAQTCLGRSTSSQGNCSSDDIACLCRTDNYANTIACCLATECDPSDQLSAANFSTVLCTSVNVTLPVFLSCNNSSSLVASGTGDGVDRTPTSSTTLQGALESQPSLITTAAAATFTGGRLLTGSCSLPQFASMTLPAGALLEYPWVGCSNEDPGCCPFPIVSGGKLSVCPADYVTTSDACCPSGWSIYTSALAGETPCVSSLSLPLVPPTIIASPGVSASAITNQLFTYKYALAAKPSNKLSSGAIAGTAIGSISGIALVLVIIILLIRRRHAKARTERKTSTTSRPETIVKAPSELDPDTKAISELPTPHSQNTKNVSELQSPQSPELPERPVWSFRLPTSPSELAHNMIHEMPTPLPAEMEGSTYIAEHHPPGYSDEKGAEAGDGEKEQGRVMEQEKGEQ